MLCIQFPFIFRWVVTAAHCLIHKEDIFVYNGRFSIKAHNQSERVSFSNQHMYPQFDNKTNAYDIGSYQNKCEKCCFNLHFA